jgi:hypothetical protein
LSASRSLRTTCSGECRRPFTRITSWLTSSHRYPHNGRTRFNGSGHKALIRSDKPQLQGEDAFRFRHILIRDTAYDAIPKATRTVLHERFAAWLEEHGTEMVELDEILG